MRDADFYTFALLFLLYVGMFETDPAASRFDSADM